MRQSLERKRSFYAKLGFYFEILLSNRQKMSTFATVNPCKAILSHFEPSLPERPTVRLMGLPSNKRGASGIHADDSLLAQRQIKTSHFY
jgi:hypothetical protein